MEIELQYGTTLQNGKYTIVKTLGQGSFGITYLATTRLTMMGKLGQMDTTVNVAIKEFFMSEMNSRANDGSSLNGSSGSLFYNYQQKFRKEAENLSRLDHPNIVKVLEVFDENNTTYYVMQYIDGESLDDYILQQNGIKEGKAISILKEIGKAVQYMHSNKMLHLDLKPKNVMLDKDGKVYLIDFGLSKQYDSKGEPESSTKVGAGTPGYAPIEQANYREGKGFPVTMDVYALGATMFKMLTGVRPPEASDILNDGFPLYELQEHKISDKSSVSVAKAMAPAKKDRYKTVEDFMISFEEDSATNYSVMSMDYSSSSNNCRTGITNGKHIETEKGLSSHLFYSYRLNDKIKSVSIVLLFIILGGGILWTLYSKKISSNDFSKDVLGLCPDSKHPHKIDMGCGVMWSCCNIGAISPIGFGDYFSWGETSIKDSYRWNTYKWGHYEHMTKYCNNVSDGIVDNKVQLEHTDDAAQVNWGGIWRIPTKEEFSMIVNNCKWEWCTLNGVDGYKVTSSTGNAIFLPATGYRLKGDYRNEGDSYYWCSTLNSSCGSEAYELGFNDKEYEIYKGGIRFMGQAIRPVAD